MAANERLTQRELADRLGVSQASISRALAGNHRHSAKLLTLVKREAQKAGYRPDPVLACLNAYRRTRRPIAKGGSLIWFGATRPGERGYEGILYRLAKKRSEQLGYGLDYQWRFEKGMGMDRFRQICKARGVAGLILGPQPEAHAKLEVDVSDVAAVAIGRSVDWPAVDLVAADHFQTMERCFQGLLDLGHRRIGFALTSVYNERVARLWSGAFLAQQYRNSQMTDIPPLLEDVSQNPAKFKSWFRKWKPDAILTMAWQFGCLSAMEKNRIAYPRDVSLALLVVPRYDIALSHYSGICEPVESIARLAVDVLVGRIRNNETGLASERRIHLLPGRWTDGVTAQRHR